MGRRTAIFDLDGTLVDTGPDLAAAANACFRDMGHGDLLDLTRTEDRAACLRGGRSMLRLGLGRLGPVDDAVLDAWYRPLLDHYERRLCVGSALYPGVPDAMAVLRDDGWALGICTNKPAALAERLMVALGARDWFGALVGADTLAVRKPDPAPLWAAVDGAGGDRARCVLIGDTETDHHTARAAGVPSVLVTFGPDPRHVAALDADGWLPHFGDLPAVLGRLVA
ncbi:phosphoglycolate phosphatase [Oceaniovalibus guishaninsula JLT2003]|uniref:phosphoglycolate phosphatase n=1 Tax=Oceaniovalibus guishaninsula JLT2003 TaxID=1231392 RepID=K2I5S6_9RHOB|nr:HAD-IA family hydrolase [Oceaniovalibus guishaninsula]EKE44320.1 phosphoglycolate phosphatase [Oceaniovalibus guishaninsula JLT2003]